MREQPARWATRLDPALIAWHTASGAWTGRTLDALARERARDEPGRVAIVDGAQRKTFGQLYAQALRVAAGLRDTGLAPGEVIAFQLPNWWEAAVINLAAAMGSWVALPIVPIYREAELGVILGDSQARVIFVPQLWRNVDYPAMIGHIRAQLPQLDAVVVVRGDGGAPDTVDFSGLGAASRPWLGQDKSANDVKLLLYTSGTTGRPKGVLHSHNTIMAELDAVSRFWRVTADDVVLMPSPVTHITGYLYALEYVFTAGLKVALMDRWDAAAAIALSAAEGASVSVAATPFLAEFVGSLESTGTRLPAFRIFASGGAPVPPDVVRRAAQVLPDCLVCRVYGSSEAPTVTLGIDTPAEREQGMVTDGRVVNHEVRIVDPVTGAALPLGMEGEITTRGPEVMLGYRNAQDTGDAFDADGYFLTGDMGVLTADGFLTVTGRKKDLIIRGGEKISPREIEDLLHAHPDIAEAAVVAMPHARLGETAFAWVVLRPHKSLSFESLSGYLEGAHIAKQKFPEGMAVVDSLPKTASGKVLKHVLRQRAAQHCATSNSS
jgi:acyl-CoA synthetase (AMP-forming)/AMP-acid ligase II